MLHVYALAHNWKIDSCFRPTPRARQRERRRPAPLLPPGVDPRNRLRSEGLSLEREELEPGWPPPPPPPPPPGPSCAAPLTRDAVVLRGGAGQAARQVRGELGGVAVASRRPQRPRRSTAHRTHPARRPRPSLPRPRKPFRVGGTLPRLERPGRPDGSVGPVPCV